MVFYRICLAANEVNLFVPFQQETIIILKEIKHMDIVINMQFFL